MEKQAGSEKVTTRGITGDDVEGVASLHEIQNERPADRGYVEHCISGFPSALTLCRERIVGFAYSDRFAPDVLSLSNILVAADFRGRGIGKRLLRRIEEQAADRWASIVVSHSELWPHPPRRSPIAFYLSNGYQRIWQTRHTTVLAKHLGG